MKNTVIIVSSRFLQHSQ